MRVVETKGVPASLQGKERISSKSLKVGFSSEESSGEGIVCCSCLQGLGCSCACLGCCTSDCLFWQAVVMDVLTGVISMC